MSPFCFRSIQKKNWIFWATDFFLHKSLMQKKSIKTYTDKLIHTFSFLHNTWAVTVRYSIDFVWRIDIKYSQRTKLCNIRLVYIVDGRFFDNKWYSVEFRSVTLTMDEWSKDHGIVFFIIQSPIWFYWFARMHENFGILFHIQIWVRLNSLSIRCQTKWP